MDGQMIPENGPYRDESFHLDGTEPKNGASTAQMALPSKGKLVLSTLPKTWIFDLDGTLVKHNGYLLDGEDSLLPGAKEFLDNLPVEDMILILTSRTEEYREKTLNYLKSKGIRYDFILFNAPMGERVLLNDRKPSGLKTALAFNLERDSFYMPELTYEL